MRFSVAMSVYKGDNPEYFKAAVDSILDQTVKPDEVVLVVDGPVPDELEKAISVYENNKVFKIIKLTENKGLGNALKLCVSNSSYELIARMDADDVSSPDRFEQQLNKFTQNPQADVVGGDITEFIDTPENIVGKRTVPANDEDIKAYLKIRCPLNHVTVMMKKDSLEKCGGYMDWLYNEDYYLWIRMYLNGCNFLNTETVLVNVRVGKDMYNRRGGKIYFKSEVGLQRLMYDKKIITFRTYTSNVIKRFIVQILLPNRLRGWVFKKFARE